MSPIAYLALFHLPRNYSQTTWLTSDLQVAHYQNSRQLVTCLLHMHFVQTEDCTPTPIYRRIKCPKRARRQGFDAPYDGWCQVIISFQARSSFTRLIEHIDGLTELEKLNLIGVRSVTSPLKIRMSLDSARQLLQLSLLLLTLECRHYRSSAATGKLLPLLVNGGMLPCRFTAC